MEIVIAAVVVALGLAAGLVVAALLLAKRLPGFAGTAQARTQKPPKTAARDDVDALARSAEIGRQEERLVGREEALETRLREIEAQQEALARRERELTELREHHVRELERVSGMAASQAKHHPVSYTHLTLPTILLV